MPAAVRRMRSPPARKYRSLPLRGRPGRLDGPGWGEPFGPLPFGLRPDWRTGGRSLGVTGTAAVADGVVIDPDSTGVERHRLEIAEQLYAGLQVADVHLIRGVFVLQDGLLG